MLAVCQTQTLPSFAQLALLISGNHRFLLEGFSVVLTHTAHLTVPLHKCFLTWERDLGTEAITITSGNPQLLLIWGTSKARNQGFLGPEKRPPHLAQLSPNPD